MRQGVTIICTGIGQGKQRQDLTISGELADGVWAHGLASISHWNGATHVITNATLERAGERLAGQVSVAAQPDSWLPKDRRPVPFTVEIDAPLDGGPGCFTSGFGGEERRGTATVELRAPAASLPLDADLLLDLIPYGESGPRHDEPCYTARVVLREGALQAIELGKTFHKRAARFHRLEPLDAQLDTDAFVFEGEGPVVAAHDLPAVDGRSRWRLSGCRAEDRVAGTFSVTWPGADGPITRQGGFSGALVTPRPADIPPAIWRYEADDAPWFQPVDGHRPVAPGEHPRLLFRREDVPALRARGQTPAGQAMLRRLRLLLGADGEQLPAERNPHAPVNKNARGPAELGCGAFTAWHCSGYALLHLVTGEQHYAALAFQALELLWQGVPDRDERYAWSGVSGLRIGPVLAGAALSYDLCYEAWSPAQRSAVVRRLMDYDDCDPQRLWTIDRMLFANGYPPGSNHYGAYIGGPGLVALALRDDPDVDPALIERWLGGAHQGIVRVLSYGFGDHGGFSEGHHPSRLSANSGLIALFQAMRVADGRNYLQPRSNAAWLTLRWIHLITAGVEGPVFTHHGTYGGDAYDAWGLSHGGEFAAGFGAIDPALRPALLWTWQHCIAGRQACADRASWLAVGEDSFDILTYPHRALHAFVNWPLEQEPVDPAQLLPRVLVDRVHGYIHARERWQDADDLRVSLGLDTGPRGYYRFNTGTAPLRIAAGERRVEAGLELQQPEVIDYHDEPDGSHRVAWFDQAGVSGWWVDLSGRTGARLVAICAGPAAAAAAEADGPGIQLFRCQLDEVPAWVVVLDGSDVAPEVTGNSLTIAGRRVVYDPRTGLGVA